MVKEKEKRSPRQIIGEVMMAFGEGMTGRPFYTGTRKTPLSPSEELAQERLNLLRQVQLEKSQGDIVDATATVVSPLSGNKVANAALTTALVKQVQNGVNPEVAMQEYNASKKRIFQEDMSNMMSYAPEYMLDPLSEEMYRETPSSKGKAKGIEKLAEMNITAGAELEKLGLERTINTLGKVNEERIGSTFKGGENLARIASSFQVLIGAAKQAKKEQGGLGYIQSKAGNLKRAFAKSGIPEALGIDIPLEEQMSGKDIYTGQLNEIVIALSPILTGANRIIEGIVNRIATTLPDLEEGTTEAAFTGQLRQSLRNAFGIVSSIAELGLNKEDLLKINDADQETIIKFIDSASKAGKLTNDEQELFDAMWQDLKDTPASVPETMFNNDSETIKSLGFDPDEYEIVK